MRKKFSLLMAACIVFALFSCGAAMPVDPEIRDWTQAGYFQDENENMLSITWMEDIYEPGWYVGIMIGDFWGGCTLPQEGNSLHGNLNAWDESAEPLIITISDEGDGNLLLVIEGDESYHFKKIDIPEATIVVTINTDGRGNIAWTEGEEAQEI